MLTNAPIPSVSTILKAFFSKTLEPQKILSPWLTNHYVGGLLSKSSWSLALIVLWKKKQSKKININVWVPEYYCEQSLVQMRLMGSNIIYYPINEDLSPDIEKLKAKNKGDQIDVIVGVHYFGKPINLIALREYAKIKKAWFVEDAVHVIRPIKGVGQYGDFIMYSPYKHLPIRNGAVLLLSTKGPTGFCRDEIVSFGSPNDWADSLVELSFNDYLQSLLSDFFWLLKRIIQLIGYTSNRQYKASFLSGISDSYPPQISFISKKLLQLEGKKLDDLFVERKLNQLVLNEFIQVTLANKGIAYDRKFDNTQNNDDFLSYMVCYEFSKETTKEVMNLLCRLGIPHFQWPDLPQEVIKLDQSVAKKKYYTQVYIPAFGMISKKLLSELFKFEDQNKEKVPEIKLRLVNDNQWDEVFRSINNISYLQENFYTSIKCNSENWRVKKIIFMYGGKNIAGVQVLQKRIFIFKLRRINRGPIFCNTNDTLEREAVWRKIASLGNIYTLSILSIAPAVLLSAKSLQNFLRLGFKRTSLSAWESSIIDLGQPLTKIRENLSGNWKKMLEEAGTRKYIIAESFSSESFMKVLNLYNDFQWKK